MSLSPAAREYLLAFADDEHCVGARHTAWIGLGPYLEEDLAFCSIAQDELGHAIALYDLLLDDPGDVDTFAIGRQPDRYRSCWLAEAECSAWNDSLVRHWLYDRAEALRWGALAGCADRRLVDLAARAQREESFHLTHAEQVMARLAATAAAAELLVSIERLLPMACALWTPVAAEPDAIEEGFVAVSSAELASSWESSIRADLSRWALDVDWPPPVEVDDLVRAHDRRRRRSAAFAALHADIGLVVAEDPAAVW